MRRLLVALAASLLGGCWVSGDFYAASDLRQPISPGTYRWGWPDGAGPRIVQVSHGRDGFTVLSFAGEDGRAGRIGLTPLDAEERAFAAWAVRENDDGPPTAQIYGLLGRMDDGSYRIIGPNCEKDRWAAGGAEIEHVGLCRFRSRETLPAGLRRLVPRLRDGISLTRIGAAP